MDIEKISLAIIFIFFITDITGADIEIKSKNVKYVIRNQTSTLENNRQFCQRHGMELAIITNETQNVFIQENARNYTNGSLTLGAIWNNTTKLFEWDDRSEMKYTNWNPNMPRTISCAEDDCCQVNMHVKLGVWNIFSCRAQAHGLCQQTINLNETDENVQINNVTMQSETQDKCEGIRMNDEQCYKSENVEKELILIDSKRNKLIKAITESESPLQGQGDEKNQNEVAEAITRLKGEVSTEVQRQVDEKNRNEASEIALLKEKNIQLLIQVTQLRLNFNKYKDDAVKKLRRQMDEKNENETAEITRLKGEVTNLQTQVNQSKNDESRLRGEVINLQTQVNQSKNDESRLREKVMNLQMQVNQSKDDETRLQGEVLNLQTLVNHSKNEETRLRKEVINLQTQVNQSKDDETRLRGEVLNLQTLMNHSKNEESRLREKVINLQEEVSELEIYVDKINQIEATEIRRLKREMTGLKGDVTKLQEQVVKCSEQTGKLQEDAQGRNKKIERLRTKYTIVNKWLPHQLLGIDNRTNQWKLSEPNITDIGDEYLFTLDAENIILDYDTCDPILVPKERIIEAGANASIGLVTNIYNDNKYNVMIEKPNQEDRDVWSMLIAILITDPQPPFTLITVMENEEESLILIIDSTERPFINEHIDTNAINGSLKWELKILE